MFDSFWEFVLKKWCVHILLLCIALGCGGANTQIKQESRSETPPTSVTIDSNLDTLDGEEWALSHSEAKPILMMIFTSWCKSCYFSLRQLDALRVDPRFRGRLHIVGVLLDSKQRKEVAEDLLTGAPIGFPIVVSTSAFGEELKRVLKVSGVPASCILDQTGQVVEVFEGSPPVSYLARRAMAVGKESK